MRTRLLIFAFLCIAVMAYAVHVFMQPDQSPLPPAVQVDPPFLPPTFKAKAKRQKAIFCEPLLGCPAYYDDKELMKVGKYGLKYYEWADVIVGDEP